MKKLMVIIIILFLCLSYAINASAKKTYTVVIDPGHGGVDPGTVIYGINEKDINLKISLYLADILNNKNNVLMTRNDDYDLGKPNATYRKKSDFDNRILYINNSNADFYISIHQNHLNDNKYYGPQVFYTASNKKYAEIMQTELNKINNTNRKIKPIPSNVYMYRKLKVPGLLIECGFMSNDMERNNLIDYKYQKKIAEAISNGLTKIQNI